MTIITSRASSIGRVEDRGMMRSSATIVIMSRISQWPASRWFGSYQTKPWSCGAANPRTANSVSSVIANQASPRKGAFYTYTKVARVGKAARYMTVCLNKTSEPRRHDRTLDPTRRLAYRSSAPSS